MKVGCNELSRTLRKTHPSYPLPVFGAVFAPLLLLPIHRALRTFSSISRHKSHFLAQCLLVFLLGHRNTHIVFLTLPIHTVTSPLSPFPLIFMTFVLMMAIEAQAWGLLSPRPFLPDIILSVSSC